MPGSPVASVMNPLFGTLGMIQTGVPTVLVGLAKMPIACRGISVCTPHPSAGIPPLPIHPPNPILTLCSERVLTMGGMAVAHGPGPGGPGSMLACKHTLAVFPPNITVLVGTI